MRSASLSYRSPRAPICVVARPVAAPLQRGQLPPQGQLGRRCGAGLPETAAMAGRQDGAWMDKRFRSTGLIKGGLATAGIFRLGFRENYFW
jgi:hypothetical protein